MNAQTAEKLDDAQPIILGRYRLYHYQDGTFEMTTTTGKTEVPLLGVLAPSSPIELQTSDERHALFVRHCNASKSEVVLWDERLIDGVPVRWEILLREEENDNLHMQIHFLSYGAIQAEVRFLCDFSGIMLHTKTFLCPHASALLVTPRGAFSVVTLEPASPASLHMQGENRLMWALPSAPLHQQTLRLHIHYQGHEQREVDPVQHVEYRTALLSGELSPLPSRQLRAAAQSAVALLLNPERQVHFAEDQLALRVAPGDRRLSVFTLAAAKALLDWNRFSGDESALWTARLAINSAMDFQILHAQSSNSGACWDTIDERKQGSDITGRRRLDLHRNARVIQQTLQLHRDTGSELCARVALNGVSWLLLKRGATGSYDGSLVQSDGTVQGGSGKGIMGAIISVMCAAYSLTETEAYMHAANRLAEYLLRDGCLPLSPGSVLPAECFPHLYNDVFAAASAIEGLTRLYRAYPRDPVAEGALRMMQWLSLWQLQAPMEGIGEAGEVLAGEISTRGFVDASIEGARGALWAFSLNGDARWFVTATRALYAAASYLDPLAGFPETKLAYPDHVVALATFIRTYLHWLLSLPTFAPEVECDPDLLVCRQGSRIFVPEPSLWRSIRVQARGLLDWIALVCPATHDILLAVLTDGSSGAAMVEAGEHRRIAVDLITGTSGAVYPLHAVPGAGSIGVYILQA